MVSQTINCMKRSLKQQRIFDENLKKEIVSLIERGKLNVTGASNEYGASPTIIYRWLHKYSKHLKKGEIVMVKKKDQEQKKQELENRIAELERALGRKQMEVEYLNKLIEIASEKEKIEIKKNSGPKLSSGSKPSDTNTDGE